MFFFCRLKKIRRREKTSNVSIVYFRNMLLSNALANVNVIRPLPRFYTLRFGRRRRRTVFDDEDEKLAEYKIKEVRLRRCYSWHWFWNFRSIDQQ